MLEKPHTPAHCQTNQLGPQTTKRQLINDQKNAMWHILRHDLSLARGIAEQTNKNPINMRLRTAVHAKQTIDSAMLIFIRAHSIAGQKP